MSENLKISYIQDTKSSNIIKEKSCGALVFSGCPHNTKVLLIKHVNGGHIAFPKGHVENGETDEQTALREIKEETGLDVCLDTDFRFTTRYSPMDGVVKDVVYFAAFSQSEAISMQKEEISSFVWCNLKEAENLITYENDKQIFYAAKEYIEQAGFWKYIRKLVSESNIVIDRKKGSKHPKFPDTVYELDYGYLDGTLSTDNEGIDCFVGSDGKEVTGVAVSVDLLKRDCEITILIGCSKDEEDKVYTYLNRYELMRGFIIPSACKTFL